MPIQSSILWAKNYRNMLKRDYRLAGFYPHDVRLDNLNKKYLYECDPILMTIDQDYIKSVFNHIKLTDFEIKRNMKSDLYMVGFQDTENIIINVD